MYFYTQTVSTWSRYICLPNGRLLLLKFFFVNLQGKTKGLQTKSASSRHAAKAAANMKKGQRHIAPKKAVLVKQATVKKVSLSKDFFFFQAGCLRGEQSLTAKINKSIERSMVSAASSGKLTIMKNATDEYVQYFGLAASELIWM